MFQRILVPLDGSSLSEQVVPFAAALAKAAKGSVTLLHVVDVSALQDTGQVWVEMPSVKQFVDEELARARTYLETVQGRLQADGVAAEIEVAIGTPTGVIGDAIENTKADLVAMSTHGRSGLARWVIGSVADKVIRESGKPLLLFRPQEGAAAGAATIRNIIIPLDGSELAEQALPTAEALAKDLDGTVTVFRAVSTYTFAFAEPYPFGGAEATADILEAIEQEAEDYVAGKVGELSGRGVKATGKRVLGDPATQLVDLAHETADSLTVMSTHGRSGVARTLLGSVADKVVRSSGRPVLLVRVN